MPSVLEFGYLGGHTLVMLERIMSEIFMPLLVSVDVNDGSGGRSKRDEGPSYDRKQAENFNDTFKNEFLISTWMLEKVEV